MEDCFTNLKQFSKLDFQSKREMINNGRPIPELKYLLQTTGQKVLTFAVECFTFPIGTTYSCETRTSLKAAGAGKCLEVVSRLGAIPELNY